MIHRETRFRSWLPICGMCVALMAFCQCGRADDVVARYVGTSQGSSGGHSVAVLRAKTMAGSNVSLVIPNDDPKKPTPTPSKEIMDTLKGLKPGQLLKISVDKDPKQGIILRSVDEYKPQPGEDTPNGYVFSKSIEKPAGKSSTTMVVLTKFGQEFTFAVPAKRGEGGVMESDPDVMASLSKLQTEAPVWAQHRGNQLLAIEPYTEPQTGKLVKLSVTEVDGRKVKSTEVDQDGKSVTLLVPGKAVGKRWVPDSTVTSQLARVHAGSMVAFRTHEDGDKTWLREILPAPKTTGAATSPRQTPTRGAK